MEKYDYRKAMKRDIRRYIEDELNLSDFKSKYDLKDYLNDELWIADSVTGNGSGSYSGAWDAEECICHNLDLLGEAMKEFCCEVDALKKGAEWCDVTIRCYLLWECLSAVVDEMEDWNEEDNRDSD